MTTPEGPAYPPEHPADRPEWGRPPPGGWGDPSRGAVPPGPWSPQQPGWGPPPLPPHAQAPNPQWPGPQAPYPAWAQQPPPGGGWAGGQQGGPGGRTGPPPQTVGGPYPGGQQYGAPQWGPQGYPPLPGASGRPERRRTPLIVACVVVALLAVGAVLAFVAPGFLRPVVFDQAALHSGVQRVLVEGYGVVGVGEVVCGDPTQGPIPVRAGDVFTCSTTVAGDPVTVSVTITSGSGDYEVSSPR